ncbi:MAG TPA: AAA family ATPase, partial [Nitrolancea sp.]|nr:AAA family ATPase [Nitrolancea sp.]
MTQETLAERASLSVRAISDLERGLKATPRRETVELLAAALGLPVEELERAVARRRGARSGRSPAQLPAAPTPLVGREAEVRALTRLLRQDDTRLVTVTGPPGIGKTRLALAVAEAVAGGFPGGVVFVPLAAQRDPAQVPLNLAQALGVPRDGPGSLTERLAEELRGRQVLVLLDNFEQVLEAAPTLAELLAACPRLKLLVTSRAALQLQSEHRCALAPLGVPAPGQLPALDDLASVPAVVLFERRA